MTAERLKKYKQIMMRVISLRIKDLILLTTVLETNNDNDKDDVGILDYMAPEMKITDEEKSPMVDMFSFEVTIADNCGKGTRART
jgi:hypothetical protein